MVSLRSVSFGFAALALIACSGAPDASDPNDQADQETEQDLTVGRAQLKGSWVRIEEEAGGFGAQAIYFSPDGTFFRDNQSVLLGVAVGPGKAQREWRDEGTYKVNTTKHTVTLSFKGPLGQESEALAYDYTPMKIMLGVAVNGGSMPHGPAKLSLRRMAAPGSHVAFPAENFEQADSYCKSNADCVKERKDKTWEVLGQGNSVCAKAIDSAASLCELN